MTTNISGQWSGTYYYPTGMHQNMKTSVPFDAKFQQLNNELIGQITEKNTFAPMAGSVLLSQVSGYVVGGIINFSKSYNSGVNAAHMVDYHGYITNKGKTISGHWQIDTWSGTFEMHRETKGSQRKVDISKKEVANA